MEYYHGFLQDRSYVWTGRESGRIRQARSRRVHTQRSLTPAPGERSASGCADSRSYGVLGVRDWVQVGASRRRMRSLHDASCSGGPPLGGDPDLDPRPEEAELAVRRSSLAAIAAMSLTLRSEFGVRPGNRRRTRVLIDAQAVNERGTLSLCNWLGAAGSAWRKEASRPKRRVPHTTSSLEHNLASLDFSLDARLKKRKKDRTSAQILPLEFFVINPALLRVSTPPSYIECHCMHDLQCPEVSNVFRVGPGLKARGLGRAWARGLAVKQISGPVENWVRAWAGLRPEPEPSKSLTTGPGRPFANLSWIFVPKADNPAASSKPSPT
ncbi:hypothetical protein B0H11DRAFT_1901036 [Mycena galericulata]|nr:hypothetical protein B0H11DRAFT_1901036 [Mycena galericulata]